jgi:hypothetical protein
VTAHVVDDRGLDLRGGEDAAPRQGGARLARGSGSPALPGSVG